MAVRLYRQLIAALAAIALLSACADSGVLTWDPETKEERELREQAERLQSTKGEGSLSGALVGALLGLATGNLGGVAAGAKFGRLAGAGAGLYIKQLQEDFADQEARLAQVSSDIQESINDANEALETMRIVAAQQTAQIAELKQAIAANTKTSADLERRQTRAQSSLTAMQKAIEGLERREAIFAETRAQVLEQDSSPRTRSLTETEVDPYLQTLQSRISAMREVAENLSDEV